MPNARDTAYAKLLQHYPAAGGANLLTGDTATFAATLGTWAPNVGCSVAWLGTDGHLAVGCAQITSTTGVTMTIKHSVTALPVNPGDKWLLSGWFKGVTVNHNTSVSADFLTAGDVLLETQHGPLTFTSLANWKNAQLTAVAPSGAAKMRVYARVLGPAVNEVFLFDDPTVAPVPHIGDLMKAYWADAAGGNNGGVWKTADALYAHYGGAAVHIGDRADTFWGAYTP